MGKKTILETSTSKKDQRKQKTYQSFLDATKDIIMAEGYEAVTVRKVAEITGYTYPTLYHYFSDLNELMWEARSYMVREMVRTLPFKMQHVASGVDGIKEIFRIYMEYYFQHPNIFKFFYFSSLNKPVSNQLEKDTDPDFQIIWQELFREMVEAGKLTQSAVEVISKTILYAIHGMITLCLSNNGELTQENIYSDLDHIINRLLPS